MSSRQLTIGLPWHTLGHGNLGVDALTRANMAIVRAAAKKAGRDVRFITLCSTGVPAEVPSDVEIGPRLRIKPFLKGKSDFVYCVKTCDLVLDIGEGDSWTDIYGRQRFVFHAGTKLVTIALRKPLVLAPQTIGPFNHPVSRHISNFIMNRARAVYTRDTLSTAYVAKQNLRTESREFIDVAFRLPFERQGKSGTGVRVGVNVSGLLYYGGYSGRNELGMTIDYAEYTHKLIAELLARGAEVHMIPHVTSAMGGNDDDSAAIPALKERFGAIRVPEPFADSVAAKSFMSGLDFVVGGRMHACIGAFSSGTPVVPVAYSRKFNGLFNTLGYSHFVDGRSVDTGTALDLTLAAFDNRNRLEADIQVGLAVAMTRLEAYEDALAQMLGALP